jgi:hypothetical protein
VQKKLLNLNVIMRPTKYNEQILKQSNDYLDNYENYKHPFPSVVGLSRVLKIAHSAIKRWGNDEDKPEFKATLEQIKDEQHLQLIHNGILGQYNAAITKLMLHNFGYSDKQVFAEEKPQQGTIVVNEALTIEQWKIMGQESLKMINKAHAQLKIQ